MIVEHHNKYQVSVLYFESISALHVLLIILISTTDFLTDTWYYSNITDTSLGFWNTHWIDDITGSDVGGHWFFIPSQQTNEFYWIFQLLIFSMISTEFSDLYKMYTALLMVNTEIWKTLTSWFLIHLHESIFIWKSKTYEIFIRFGRIDCIESNQKGCQNMKIGSDIIFIFKKLIFIYIFCVKNTYLQGCQLLHIFYNWRNDILVYLL